MIVQFGLKAGGSLPAVVMISWGGLPLSRDAMSMPSSELGTSANEPGRPDAPAEVTSRSTTAPVLTEPIRATGRPSRAGWLLHVNAVSPQVSFDVVHTVGPLVVASVIFSRRMAWP